MSKPPFILSPATQRKVDELKYTVEPNHARYRSILRFFYREHVRHRDWISPRDVYAAVAPCLEAEYTLEECERDLQTLESWGNLQAGQARTKPITIAEWNRPRQEYHITPFTVDLEALLSRFESDQRSGGALNATLLERMWTALRTLQGSLERPIPEGAAAPQYLQAHIATPWASVLSSLGELREGSAAYHSTLSATVPTDATAIEPFLVYKDLLLSHLDGFVQQLQATGPRLRALTDRWQREGTGDRLVTLLTESDRLNGVSRLSVEGALLTWEEVRETVHRPAFRGVAEWFALRGSAEMLLQATSTAIQQIVRLAARIATRHDAGISRRRDLERLARALATLELDGAPEADAHRLMARAFGTALPRHLRGATGADVLMTDTAASVWHQVPQSFPLQRIRRGRPAKEQMAAMADTSAEQARMEAEEERRLEAERRLWDRLFAAGTITLASLTVEEPVLRQRILDVVRRALIHPDHLAQATDGRTVRVLTPADEWEYGELAGPDGTLVLPAMTLTIEEADSPTPDRARRHERGTDAPRARGDVGDQGGGTDISIAARAAAAMTS